MFEGVKSGWELIKISIRSFNVYPKLLIPLIITWSIYSPVILYLEYFFNWDALNLIQTLIFIFLIVFTFAFLLAFSCSLLLELIQQLESGEKMSLSKAFFHTLKYNVIKIIPIVFIWAIIWFILIILESIFSKSRKEKKSFTVKEATKTLAGYKKFSFLSASFRALRKGVRMVVFLILPAIAWENLGFREAIKKGLMVFKVHISKFVSGFILTEALVLIVFTPVGLLLYVSDIFDITFPTFVWLMAIIYIGFAWSYSIYIEQMFSAELYLWHLKWEKQIEKDKREGKPLSKITDVKIPSILDKVPEFLKK